MSNTEGKPKKIAVYTKDGFLFQKILLDAPDGLEIIRGGDDTEDCVRLVDVDTVKAPDGAYISMSRRGGADISIPFPLGTLDRFFSEEQSDSPQLSISEKERAAYLRGERIRLTELEYALLSHLMKNGGGYSPKEELLRDIWKDDADPGIINVYIHYLREKLEKHGEKIILSSRKRGYKIDEKYAGGKRDA